MSHHEKVISVSVTLEKGYTKHHNFFKFHEEAKHFYHWQYNMMRGVKILGEGGGETGKLFVEFISKTVSTVSTSIFDLLF